MTPGTARRLSRPAQLGLILGLVLLPVAPAAAVPSAAELTARSSVTSETAEEVTYYEVRTNADGEPEFLFEIAERYLGNGNRYTEIFEMNEGRPQPGGGALTDPSAVEPGWILLMPSDAEGEGIVVGPLPDVSESTPGASETAPGAEPSSPSSEAGGSESSAPGGAEEGSSSTASDGPPVLVIVLVIVAIVIIGAVAVLLVRRGRRNVEQPFDDSLLRTDTASSWIVDRALRVLVRANAEDSGMAVPGVVAVHIEGSALRLRLASPSASAPEPWTASEDGLSWVAPITALQNATVGDESTERFARLVSLGVSESGRVLVDFGRARGLISLEGPTALKHEVLRRWLGELSGNPWSDHPRVVMIGNGLPQPEAAEHLTSLEQLLPELETERSWCARTVPAPFLRSAGDVGRTLLERTFRVGRDRPR